MPAQPPPITSKALEANYLSHEQGPDCFALISSLTPQTLPRYGDVEVKVN